MKAEKDFIIEYLKKAGVHGKIHESMKSLRNCNETHVGAVLRVKESLTRSKSKKIYEDQAGQWLTRKRLFERVTIVHVVIADSDDEKVDKIFTQFLTMIPKGLAVEGNWVEVELGEAEWVDGEDSILRSKVAVEFDVTMTGGVYIDKEMKHIALHVPNEGKADEDGKIVLEN